MFAPADRDRVQARLLALAEADEGIVGAAVTGSGALGATDLWSDVDLAFGVAGELEPALERWTALLHGAFDAVHHWDLPSGSAIYRVFLLSGWLEVDLAFVPAADFGPRGPSWRTVFGETVEAQPAAIPPREALVGHAWHHALHARSSIERGRAWQAAYWLGALRDQVIALACLRLGHASAHAKGAHLLPVEITGPLEETLVRSLDEAELRRALAAGAEALGHELETSDQALAARLRPMLQELAGAEQTAPEVRG